MKKYIPQSTLNEILKVLQFGDIKHPGENWKKEDAKEHLLHAINHISIYSLNKTNDAETGCSHLAHAVCRLLFAMSKGK